MVDITSIYGDSLATILLVSNSRGEFIDNVDTLQGLCEGCIVYSKESYTQIAYLVIREIETFLYIELIVSSGAKLGSFLLSEFVENEEENLDRDIYLNIRGGVHGDYLRDWYASFGFVECSPTSPYDMCKYS